MRHQQPFRAAHSSTPISAFVHEFRPLAVEPGRTPGGVHFPPQPFDSETIAAKSGSPPAPSADESTADPNGADLEINALQEVNKAVVEAARESFVMAQL